jgi:hypothetical protein
MKTLSESVIKHLFALSRNICAYPNCDTEIVQQTTGTVIGNICHIKGLSPGGPRYDPNQTDEERNSFENLILLCGVHHKIVDDQPDKFTVEALQKMKEKHEQSRNIKLSQDYARLVNCLIDSSNYIEANNGAQVIVNSPGAIQTKTLTIKTTKKAMPPIHPIDSIGANTEMRAYVKYLTKRYNEWRMKEKQSGKDNRPYHYSMIYKRIEKDFGASTNYVPQCRFRDLVEYLQTAIDRTIFGKNRHLHGERNYHSFEEHSKTVYGKQQGSDI